MWWRGCNTIERMAEVGIKGAVTFAVNTDAQDLLSTRADKMIGKLTRGLGAGSDPQIGGECCKRINRRITSSLREWI